MSFVANGLTRTVSSPIAVKGVDVMATKEASSGDTVEMWIHQTELFCDWAFKIPDKGPNQTAMLTKLVNEQKTLLGQWASYVAARKGGVH